MVAYSFPAPRLVHIAEQREPLNEAELARIWSAQSFPAEALRLVDGRRLRVVLPGRAGGGSGPDFRDAIIAIDGEERRGDVELHVRATSFYEHGHEQDPAYRNLVLHVVYRADDGPVTRLPGGGRVAVAAFAPWVAGRRREIEGWLAAPPLWQEPCSDAVGRLGRAGVLARLEEEGRGRFGVKVERLREAATAHGECQALWLALLDVFGYGRERAAWRRLGELLPVGRLASLPRSAAAAALLATAGLQAAPPELEALLSRRLNVPLAGGPRPASRPERRLRALAALWQRSGGDLPAYARESVAVAVSVQQLAGAWMVADSAGGAALLGRQQAREALFNAVLPFVSLDTRLSEKALAFASQLPAAPAYGKTAFLEAALRRGEPALRFRRAFEQQGLLAMAAGWCRQGGCGRCPLS